VREFAHLSNYLSLRRVTGDKHADDELYTSPTGSTPAAQWYWHCQVIPTDHTTGIGWRIQVHITYYCEFYRPYEVSSV
jgi:hypothetical protein